MAPGQSLDGRRPGGTRTTDREAADGTVQPMIGYLNGIAKGHDLVVVGGVGYRVQTPVALVEGEAVELHVVTIVREDAFDLFGFASPAEEQLFRQLIKATGVGPKLALGLISSLGAAEVARAIVAEDIKALSAAKGVGAKSAKTLCTAVTIAEDLLLELGADPRIAIPDSPAEMPLDDVAQALVQLGYSPAEAIERSTHARTHLGADADESALVKAALVAT